MKDTGPEYWQDCQQHTLACACREHKFAVLAKVAMDAAVELDECRSELPATRHVTHDRMEALIARLYSAVDALGVVVGDGCDDVVAEQGIEGGAA